jgi:primosomal protein N' (replication factor Y)
MRFLLTTQRGALESFLRKKLNTNAGLINRLIEIGLIEEIKDPHLHHKAQVLEKPLTVEDQQKLYSRILLMSSNRMDTYTKEIRKTLLQDQSVLVLLPEILLARTISAELEERLGDAVLLYHSSLSEGEKGRIWQQAKTNTCVVVGTRSALFLPFRNLGLIIVDQEQDRSYKQDEMIPYFNARDVALRAIQPRIILGSDAPSVETFYHAKKGRLQLNRQLNESLEVTLVDMRNERGMLSSILVESISKTLASGRRVLIGVNARGYFQAVLCKKCGRPLVCPNCGANLTYDVSAAQLVCRVCGKTQPRMVCPNCGSRSLRFVGIGSQRVEEEMRIRFPHAKIIRIDKQSLSNKKSLARAEEAIKRQAQIIIGTPLAAKGPKIDGLGLVAAIGVDNMLARPDFRAAERVYQYLIALFARLDKMGRAIIQTSYPEHYAIVAALNSNYDLFYEHEITEREALFYPPFSHLARLILPHGTDTQRLTQILQEYKLEMVGPAVHPRKQDRDVVLIKAKQSDILRQACKEIRQNISSKTKLEIDIDPDQI